jgi:hypothetical protein
MRAHWQRMSAVMLSSAGLVLGACEQDVGTLVHAHTGGDLDASVIDSGPPGGVGCTLTQGFWKNHEDDWPVTSLTLGGRTYDQATLLVLLQTPPRGDASLILARQLIAAKLNVAAGASSTGAIAEADAWIDAHDGARALPLGIRASTAAGNEAVQIAGDLEAYNEGETGPGHCPDDRPPQPCGPGLTNCGGLCVDTSSDESHCGNCDSVCFSGKTCIQGACVFPVSDAGTPMDAGTPGIDAGPPGIDAGPPEVDAGPPPVDAGPPPVDAGPPPVDAGPPPVDAGPPPVDAGAPVDAGTCPFGFSDCDGLPGNGCEANLATREYCGSCENSCPSPTTYCDLDFSLCFVCQVGGLDCDGLSGNACEVDGTTDESNCGACGNVCGVGLSCVDGDCTGASS